QDVRDGGVPAVRGDRRARAAAGMSPRRPPRWILRGAVVLGVIALAACGSAPKKATPRADAPTIGGQAAAADACDGVSPYAAAQEDPSTRGDYVAGGLYKPGVPD